MKLLSRSEHTLRRETGAATMIQLSSHVDEHVARTRAGDYLSLIHI